MNDVSTWAGLIEKSPFIALIIALGVSTIYLFKSRDKVQAKYTEDLVRAAQALQELTAEYLKQSFSDSASWQDRFKGLDSELGKHILEMDVHLKAMESRIEVLKDSLTKAGETNRLDLRESETRVKDHITTRSNAVLDRLPRN